MCCFIGETSFKDLEKSKGQAKAMVGSWVVTANNMDEVDDMAGISDFVVAKNEVNRVQEANSPHNWVFGGMPGFRKKDKNEIKSSE